MLIASAAELLGEAERLAAEEAALPAEEKEKAAAKEAESAAAAANGAAEPPSGLEHVAGEGQVRWEEPSKGWAVRLGCGWAAGRGMGGRAAGTRRVQVRLLDALAHVPARVVRPPRPRLTLPALPAPPTQEGEEEEEAMTPLQTAQHFAMRNLMNAGG